MNNRLIKSNDAGGGACTNTVDLYNPFPDGGGVALYQLNGDATDVSGNYDGTASNVTYGAGQFGQAGVFNGSTSSILLSNTIFNTSNILSFSAWVKTNSSAEGMIVSNRYGTHTFSLRMNPNGTVSAGDWQSSANNITTTTTINDGNWHNIVYINNNGTITIYIDEISSATGTHSFNSQTLANGNQIGNWDNDNTITWNGSIDQVRIFNRALRPYEVEALYTEEYCTPTIVPSEHFNTVTYTGDNVANRQITDVGFQPDLVWVKSRSNATSHVLSDSVRGANLKLRSNSTAAEAGTDYGVVSAFNPTGFSVDGTIDRGDVNFLNWTYTAWNFKAGGAAVTNTDGTITSQVSANTEAGFSIVSYSGNSTNNATIGHGLGEVPAFVIIKNRGGNNWFVYHKDSYSTPEDGYMILNSAFGYNPANSPLMFNGVAPTNTLLNLDDYTEVNGSGKDFIAYCFAEVEGFSNFGSYVGTGASGNTIVTGFEPAMVIAKMTSSTDNWRIYDNKRIDSVLYPNLSNQQDFANHITFLENGFTWNTNNSNSTGQEFIYMAFAADPTAVEPTLEDSFNTVTYTGTGSTNPITTVGFQPDLVWLKRRDSGIGTTRHLIFDSIRGVGKRISSESSDQEYTVTQEVISFDNNGFTLGSNGSANGSGGSLVSWNWKGAEIPAINSNGSIPSVVSANPAAGFSIVSWTSTATTSTIGHGLESTPSIVIMKSRTNSGDWQVYSSAIGATQKLFLNGTNAATSSGVWGNTSPNENVFTSAFNNSGNIIAYCFAEVPGFSKFGSYVGGTSNNSITLGFEPAFVMIKSYSGVAEYWAIYDNKRSPSNPVNDYLVANASFAENVNNLNQQINFDANGFTLVTTNSLTNLSGSSYIYMAFANQF